MVVARRWAVLTVSDGGIRLILELHRLQTRKNPADPSAALGLLVEVQWVQWTRTRNRPLGKEVRFVLG